MKKCVFCGKEFKELSEEHIFPNVICGKLKSKNLLCTDCNSWLGENIDYALDGVYSQITHLFKIKRERGEGQPIIVKGVTDNIEYRFSNDGSYELANVECKIEKGKEKGFELKFEAPIDKKRLKNTIGKELASRKNEISEMGLDYKKLISETHERIDNNWKELLTQTQEFKPNSLTFECRFGGKDVALAVLKIAFLFFKEVKSDVEIDDDVIISLLSSQSEKVFDRCLFFNLDRDLFEEIPDEISHFISVKGVNGKIIAYIKLFSITPYICVLKENYVGGNFEISYGYSFLKGETFSPKCFPLKDLNNIKEDLDYKKNYDNVCKNLRKDFYRIMNLYYKRNPSARKSEIQVLTEKYLTTLLGTDIVNTPYFQSLIAILGENQYFFTDKITEKGKRVIIQSLSMMLLEYAVKDAYVLDENS